MYGDAFLIWKLQIVSFVQLEETNIGLYTTRHIWHFLLLYLHKYMHTCNLYLTFFLFIRNASDQDVYRFYNDYRSSKQQWFWSVLFQTVLWDIISYMYVAKNIFYPFRNGTMTFININILISDYSCLQSCFQIPWPIPHYLLDKIYGSWYLWANKKACTAFQNEMPWPLEMYKYTQKAYEVLKREKKSR